MFVSRLIYEERPLVEALVLPELRKKLPVTVPFLPILWFRLSAVFENVGTVFLSFEIVKHEMYWAFVQISADVTDLAEDCLETGYL